MMRINECLDLAISANKSSSVLAKHEAVLRIAMWMRYPSQAEYEIFKSATICCFGKYLNDKYGNHKISDILEFELIARNFNISDFWTMFSGEKFDVPDFLN